MPKHDKQKLINGIEHRECSRCHEYKPATLDFFLRQKRGPTKAHPNGYYGLQGHCIECNRRILKEYHQRNPQYQHKMGKAIYK